MGRLKQVRCGHDAFGLDSGGEHSDVLGAVRRGARRPRAEDLEYPSSPFAMPLGGSGAVPVREYSGQEKTAAGGGGLQTLSQFM